MLLRFFPLALAVALAFGPALLLRAQDPEPIEMKTVAGLRFDPPRFVVKPGAKVKVAIENIDDMAHNFVLTAPGARPEIVAAAMTMPITPEQTFIPASAKVLQHTPVLIPGKAATLEFTAPTAEGVYPYVCTYPGHGLVMYGAMYVSKSSEQSLPPVADDVNLPDLVRDQAKSIPLHAYAAEPPYWYRIFVRESGPASIVVALPGGQNYCWDAGACRLRYAWRGAFVDPQPHWRGNGDGLAEIKGTVYFRPREFPLRFGDARKAPADVRFRGFSVVDKHPEFEYQIGGVTVRELIKAAHHGGIEATYKISGAKVPAFFVVDPEAGAEATSTAGKFSGGVLKIPVKTKEFTVAFTEIPNREPLGYWSMNDTLPMGEKKSMPIEGVNGRAITFDGKKAQFATGVKADALTAGATFAVWVRLAKPPALEQVCIGAKSEAGGFALGANLEGVAGYGVQLKNADKEAKIIAAMPMEADAEWHHLAATLDGTSLRFYLDGKPAGIAAAPPALSADAEFFLGSSGSLNFSSATLDEARIYGRVLEPKDIETLEASERAKLPKKPENKPPTKSKVAAAKGATSAAAAALKAR